MSKSRSSIRNKNKRNLMLFRLRSSGISQISDKPLHMCSNKDLKKKYEDFFGVEFEFTLKNGQLKLKAKLMIIGSIEHGFVRIDCTSNPKRRVSELQDMLPFPIEVIKEIPGSYSEEAILRKRFHEYQLLNNWFSYEGHLKDYITCLNAVHDSSASSEYKGVEVDLGNPLKLNEII